MSNDITQITQLAPVFFFLIINATSLLGNYVGHVLFVIQPLFASLHRYEFVSDSKFFFKLLL